MHKLFRGLDMSANGQAMDELLAHEPGLHHLGTAHTQANFQDAFWASGLADSNSLEQWQEEGALEAPARANRLAKKMLAEHEPPPLDPGIAEGLSDFIAEKKASMPDQWSA